ncbi:MAG: HlyD family efflux transporter periplasmic adaptor subunit [Planctomycetota bacterium]
MIKQHRFHWAGRLLLLSIPIVVGASILAISAQFRSAPEKREISEVAQPLRVITAKELPIVPKAIGLGESRPKRTWQAVCEVKGRIVEVHPRLKAGSVIAEDELLVRIDDTDINLVISRLKAEIARAEANLAELKTNETNYRELLRLEEESLGVADAEMERMRQLTRSNASSAAELDSVRRSLITQKQIVQSAKNKLNLLPAQVESAQAALRVAEANLAERQRDLERCEIRAPFPCRLGNVSLESGQFISVGEKLFSAQSNDSFLIDAEFDSQDLRRLFNGVEVQQVASSVNLSGGTNDEEVPTGFQVDVTVRYRLGGRVNECSGRVVRFREQLSDKTRSGIVVIETDAESNAGGPPPIRGTLCEIDLFRTGMPTRIAIPLSAIRQDDSVFILDKDQRLCRRGVVVEYEQGSFAVIRSGIDSGELVVVSQPQPAINGSLVDPIIDEVLQRSLTASATESEPAE